MPELIKQILDEWNPIELDYLSTDEYLPVAEEIADVINENYSPYSVCIALKRALSIYGVNFSKSHAECLAVAERIVSVMREN